MTVIDPWPFPPVVPHPRYRIRFLTLPRLSNPRHSGYDTASAATLIVFWQTTYLWHAVYHLRIRYISWQPSIQSQRCLVPGQRPMVRSFSQRNRAIHERVQVPSLSAMIKLATWIPNGILPMSYPRFAFETLGYRYQAHRSHLWKQDQFSPLS